MEEAYSIANGKKHNALVIYGDTDSVMVKFGPSDLETVMEMGERSYNFTPAVCQCPDRRGSCFAGREAADLVTAKFIKPIKLEFEKVYYPYLLINKKRYAGLYWTRPDKYDKMDSKGIEVRPGLLLDACC